MNHAARQGESSLETPHAWRELNGYDKATDELTDKIAELEDALREAEAEIERLRNNLDNIDSALFTFEKEARRWI